MKIGDMLVTVSLSEMQRLGEEGARTIIDGLRDELAESKRREAEYRAALCRAAKNLRTSGMDVEPHDMYLLGAFANEVNYYRIEREQLTARGKALEDAIKHQISHGFSADWLTRLQQALAAKEPKNAEG